MSGWVAAAAAVVLAWVVAVNVGRVRRLDRLHRRLDATRIALAAALRARWHVGERVAAGGTREPGSASGGLRALPPDALPVLSGAETGPVVPSRSEERDGPVPDVAGSGAPRSAERDRTGRRGPRRVVGDRAAERDGTLWAAVAAARSAEPDREAAENALGRALAAVDRSRLPEDLRVALADAELRLTLARRVHNDAVRDTLALRSRRLVRWLRLAGTAPMPAYFEIADPPGVTGSALPVSPAGPPG